ncbi:MAG: QueT transporter family protein [Peptococcaceae bacterium]|nr:QueT transporter family protein [Peptococcaceae bacterium]
MNVRRMARGAVIAALYAAVTLALAPFSFGPAQLRASEALTVLPVFFPEAPLGLFIGCAAANFVGGYGVADVVFGSLATLLAALCTRGLARFPFLAPLPPVVLNGVVVGYVLHAATGIPWLALALEVGAGELASCYCLGLPLLFALKRIDAHYSRSGVDSGTSPESNPPAPGGR